MNAWGQSCQDTNQSLGAAVDAMGDLFTLYRRDIDGKSKISKKTARQMGNSLAELSESLQQLTASVSGVADAHSRALMAFLAGYKLDREQFYILLATECVEWTNKNVGLSDFDDFELFDLLRYESKDQSGYIYLAPDIDDLPDADPDDWTLGFLSRTYRSAIIAPEAIQWNTLSPKQRSFFQKYLPEVVGRFIQEELLLAQPETAKENSANHVGSTSSTVTRVDMQELVAALKALRAHFKGRRKLDLIIRKSDHKGKLVLELSGRSRFTGMLTTINCVGTWKTEALVPFASFRGFVAHPPGDETAHMSFHDGRLHIGAWNCPARTAEAD